MPVTVNVTYPADGVGLIAFSDPPMNFGGGELGARILDAIEEVEGSGARVFVLASDTPGYFIAHWHLGGIVEAMEGLAAIGNNAPPSRRPYGANRMLFERVGDSPLVSIAANNGQAWGGGAELSWGCDLRIAAESATYGQPEVAIGIPPGAGGCTRLARLIGPAKCLEMILDGRPITAREALTLGAINKVVPDDDLRAEAIAWAAHIAQWPAFSLAACKQSFVEGRDRDIYDARRNEQFIFGNTARRADAIEIMKAAQARYDAGMDSYDALGIPRE